LVKIQFNSISVSILIWAQARIRLVIKIETLIRMYLTGQERRLKKLLFQIVCISFEEF